LQLEYPMSLANTSVKTIVASAAMLAAGLAFAQAAPTQGASSATGTTSAAPQSSGQINPMTGQSLSHEQLVRELAKARLTTEFKQELLKQAQTDSDLALATLRAQTEEQKLKSEMSQPASRAAAPAAQAAPRPAPPSANRASNATAAQTQSASFPTLAPASPVNANNLQSAPRGTISIGQETLSVSSMSASAQQIARVESVDTQAKAPADLFGAGAGAVGNALNSLGIGLPRPPSSPPVPIPALQLND